MKKIIIAILCLAMLFSACGKKDKEKDESSNTSETNQTGNKYIDGTYTAKWEDYVDGWQEFVTIEVKDDIVTVLQYDAVNEEGEFLSSTTDMDDDYMESNKSFGLPAIKNKDKFQNITNSFYDGDKNTEKMECVAGATRSTNRFKLMVNELLKTNAVKGNTEIAYIHTYGDGVYRVEEARFNSGWKDFVEVTVTDGVPEITRFDSYNKDGKLKSEDEDTKTRMIAYLKAKNKEELYPAQYMKELIKRFDECDNNPREIETVAGATISSDLFKELTEKALFNASIRGKTFDTIGKYKDGTYHAEMTDFIDGWKDYVDLEIKNDEVHIIEFNSLDIMGNKKTEDKEQKIAMMNGNAIKNLPETYPSKYVIDIISSFTQANSDVLEMENVSGATLSSNNFKLMVGEILRKCAIDGEVYQIKVEPYNIEE